MAVIGIKCNDEACRNGSNRDQAGQRNAILIVFVDRQLDLGTIMRRGSSGVWQDAEESFPLDISREGHPPCQAAHEAAMTGAHIC